MSVLVNGMNLFTKLFSKKHKLVCVEDKHTKTGLTCLVNDDQVAGGIGNSADTAGKMAEANLAIDSSRCRNGHCLFCTTRCPCNAISVLYGDVVIDGGKCDECGYCIEMCPVGAISFKNKNGGCHVRS